MLTVRYAVAGMQLQMIRARYGNRCHRFSASDPASVAQGLLTGPVLHSRALKIMMWNYKCHDSCSKSQHQCNSGQLNAICTTQSATQSKNKQTNAKNDQMSKRTHVPQRSCFSCVSLLLTSLVFSSFIFQCDMWLQARNGLLVAFRNFEE